MKICPKCKIKHNNSGIYCSRKCANSRIFSDESKRKKSNKTKLAHKKGIYLKFKGIHNLESRICLNSNCKKEFFVERWRKIKYCSRDCMNSCTIYKQIKSERTSSIYKNSKHPFCGKTKWYNYNNIRVQGTYELRTCKILDKWKEQNKIKDWEYTNDRIKYVGIDGNIHNYLLDFKIFNHDDSWYYIEVKGYKTNIDDLKWNAAKNLGLDLKIWYHNDIKEHEM